MPYRPFTFETGEYFHLYNRGNSKHEIFLDGSDYRRFIRSLYLANGTNPFKQFFIEDPFSFDRGEQLVAIGAYCLMPNHFHLLVTPLVENGISIFMNKISTGHSMYFNNKYERTGSLFEGRFKAQHASDDEYLRYLYAYIHLNPIKLTQHDWKEVGIKDRKGATEYLHSYKYSSFKDYAGVKRKEAVILDSDKFPNYFPDHENFLSNIFDWFEEVKK